MKRLQIIWWGNILLFATAMASTLHGQEQCRMVDGVRVCGPLATGVREFAERLNVGRFQHDPLYVGAEVIYQSSEPATEAEAIEAWKESPAHNALLPEITEVACVGNVCVGRGPVRSALEVARKPIRFLQRVQPVRKLLGRIGCKRS